MSLLKVQDLEVAFSIQKKWVPVISEISFELKKGKVLGIVGESGSGKSVSIKSLMGLIEAEGGKIQKGSMDFDGINLLGLNEKEWRKLRGRRITMIFQDPMSSLNPLMKVGKQVVEVFTNHNLCSKAEAKVKTIELFKEVGIPFAEKRFDQFPHELSGGLLQRVVIAMALAPEPDLILADEPTTALDVTIQKQILDLLKEIQQRRKMSMVFITHDLGVIREVADEVLVLYAGKRAEFIKAKDMFAQVKHPYSIGLIKSLPKPFEKAELYSIPGRVQSPADRGVGCAFADRCEKVSDVCTKESPTWRSWSDAGDSIHKGACHNA
jgi:oligopeptide/dipeptide ABC transporter ATP-binding protein